MAQDKIVFDIITAQRSEAAIRRQLVNLNTIMRELQNAVNNTSSWWADDSRNAFVRRANEFLAQKKEIEGVIAALADKLATAIRFKREQENEVSGFINASLLTGAASAKATQHMEQEIKVTGSITTGAQGAAIGGITRWQDAVGAKQAGSGVSVPPEDIRALNSESAEKERVKKTGLYISAEDAAAGKLGIWMDSEGKWQWNRKVGGRITVKDITETIERSKQFSSMTLEEKIAYYNKYLCSRASMPATIAVRFGTEERAICTLMLTDEMTDAEFCSFVKQCPEIADIAKTRWDSLLSDARTSLYDKSTYVPGVGVEVKLNWQKIKELLQTDPSKLTFAQLTALSMLYSGMTDPLEKVLFRQLASRFDYKNYNVPWYMGPKNYDALFDSYNIPKWLRSAVTSVINNSGFKADLIAKYLLSQGMFLDLIISFHDAEENKAINKEKNITGLITDQNDKSSDVVGIKMGEKYADENGCGWIATYNIMYLLGKRMEPWEIVEFYDKNGGALVDGKAGINPEAIPLFFKWRGIETRIDYLPNNIDAQIIGSGVAIFNYLHESAAHYIAVEYKNGKFVIYNDTPGDPELAASSIEEWMQSEGWLPLSLITFK